MSIHTFYTFTIIATIIVATCYIHFDLTEERRKRTAHSNELDQKAIDLHEEAMAIMKQRRK